MRFIDHIWPSLGRRAATTGSAPRLFLARSDSTSLLKSLDIGDSIAGRVVRVLGNSRVLMDFRGVELVATTTIPLSAGGRIRGVVQTKGPPLVLKITHGHLPDKSNMLFRFKHLASQFLPTVKDHPLITLLKTPGIAESDWARPLTHWLAARVLGQETASHPQRLWEALSYGGIFYERKIREWVESGGKGSFRETEVDLKGIALKLLGGMKSHWKGEGPIPENSMKPLGTLIGKIELFQTGNWLAQEKGLGIIFQIPLRFEDNLRTANLFVGLPHSKEGKKDGLRILLLLDLGEFGCLRIDTHLSQKGLTAAIGVDREETLALIRSMKKDLKKGLEGQGFAVVAIDCFLLERPAATEDLFQEVLALDEVEVINVRV